MTFELIYVFVQGLSGTLRKVRESDFISSNLV